jgi:light-regulated signal transduction histidine kinase (bacteriophytochrome)
MRNKVFLHHRVVTGLLNECSDILESLAAEQIGESSVVEKIQNRINEMYHPEGQAAEAFNLGDYVKDTIQQIKSKIQHRNIDLRVDVETSQSVSIPERILSKIVVGLVKNAIENTPDEGRIDISVKDINKGVNLSVHDFGTGIAGKHRKLIFSGFYPTQATDAYSTKNPFDFNAGGRGADLMRIKIFSERYHFNVDMASQRCRHLPTSSDTCPGEISACDFCSKPTDCHGSGETIFNVIFPADT